jgi:uncharacterized protein
VWNRSEFGYVLLTMDIDGLLEHRKAKDEFFGTSHHAPLDHHHQEVFTGLPYFDPDPGMVFNLEVEPVDRKNIKVQTSDGQERVYRRDYRVSFEVNGESASLAMYTTDQPGFFIPFRDATSGKTSYGAGRYLDLEANDDGTVTLDFNMAYNPYCAYNESYSCPLPPHENWLTVPIEAGEKDWPSQ